MKVLITITVDNAAFDHSGEVSRILRELADRYQYAPDRDLTPRVLRDVNGNAVGHLVMGDD